MRRARDTAIACVAACVLAACCSHRPARTPAALTAAHPADAEDGIAVGPAPALLLVDGASGGACVDDLFKVGANTIPVSNLATVAGCRDEVVVFRAGARLEIFRPGPTQWTSAIHETFDATASHPPLSVAIVAWVVHDPAGTSESVFKDQYARATEVFDDMLCGITFTPSIRQQQGGRAPIGEQACDDPEALHSLGYQAGALNVYYLQGVANGANCRDDRDLMWIAGTDSETLAHEIGHAFGLSQGGGMHPTVASNIMAAGVTGRSTFAPGQCLRMNLSAASHLPAMNRTLAAAAGRGCPELQSTPECPPRLWPDAEGPAQRQPTEDASLSPADAARRWLNCDDCIEDERTRVVGLGAPAEEPLATLAREPPDAAFETHLRETYLSLLRYRQRHPDVQPGSATFEAFAERARAGYADRRRLRAIVALRLMSTPSSNVAATALLNEATDAQRVRFNRVLSTLF